MKISFVVPAYNEQVLLPRSLSAIRDEISRTGLRLGLDAEIIVVAPFLPSALMEKQGNEDFARKVGRVTE